MLAGDLISLGQRQRNWRLTARPAAWALCLPWFPLFPRLKVAQGRLRWMLHTQWVCVSWGSPNLSYSMEYKQTCPTFGMEGDNIFIIVDSTQACPSLGRETLSSKAVLFIIILAKIVENKSYWCLSPHKIGRNVRPPPERYLATWHTSTKSLHWKLWGILARSSLSRIRLRGKKFCVRNRGHLSVSRAQVFPTSEAFQHRTGSKMKFKWPVLLSFLLLR